MFARVWGTSGKKFCQLLTRKKWRKKLEMCAKNNQQRVLSALCLGPLLVCLGRSTTSSAGQCVFFFAFVFLFSQVFLLIGGLENRWKDVFRCLQPIPQLLVLVCYVCLLGSLDHLVCGACVRSQISHSAQSGADPRADHNQRETSCWLGKQRNDRLVILRTWSWSQIGSERQALSCWDFCLGETCDSEVFGCSYGFIRWRPAYALGGAQMTISDSGNCYFSTKAFKVFHTTVRRSG